MIRGHGSLQRKVLEVLQEHQGDPLTTRVLSVFVHATPEQRAEMADWPEELLLQAEAKRVAVSRACHTLWRDGRITKWSFEAKSLGSGWSVTSAS